VTTINERRLVQLAKEDVEEATASLASRHEELCLAYGALDLLSNERIRQMAKQWIVVRLATVTGHLVVASFRRRSDANSGFTGAPTFVECEPESTLVRFEPISDLVVVNPTHPFVATALRIDEENAALRDKLLTAIGKRYPEPHLHEVTEAVAKAVGDVDLLSYALYMGERPGLRYESGAAAFHLPLAPPRSKL
jgi:hypothetical protein